MPSTVVDMGDSGTGANTQRDIVDIGNGEKTGDVVFAEAFAGVPSVTATVLIPDGDAQALGVTVHTVSALGFTWRLSAPAPNGNYKLHWQAAY